jgi:hypothetical protein
MAADDVKILLRIVKRADRGGAPRSFGLGHVFLALYRIDDSTPLSREKLGTCLGLGGGAVKSLVSKLRDYNLIQTLKVGNVLSDEGLRFVRSLRSLIPVVSEVSVRNLSTGRKNVAAIIRGIDKVGLEPISLRDEAIRAGGTGATTLFFDGSLIRVPGVYDDLSTVSNLDVKALTQLGLQGGDVILIVGGTNIQTASVACATVAMGFVSGSPRRIYGH